MIRRFVRTFLVLAFLSGHAALAGKDVVVLNSRLSDTVKHPPVVYWPEVRREPRPLRVHVVRVDLLAQPFELAALVAADPDGDGPAEARLEKPAELAHQPGVVAAVNANAFDPVPKPPPGESVKWRRHLPVDIIGWAQDGSRQVSAPQSWYASFWVDREGRPHLGEVAAPAEARLAVAGFKELLRDGRDVAIPHPSLHPRSAVGADRAGATLWLVVVDGRQPDYSEGVTVVELAALMKELGCWQALNLDGGGSSILLVGAGSGGLRVMNRPSDRGTRPVPVMLAVRRR